MPNDHPATTDRHGPLRWLWIALAVVSTFGVLFAALVSSGDTGTGEVSQAEETPITPSLTTIPVDPQEELVPRLREILARREAAYRERNPNLLREIFAVDCPCLRSDTNAIRELISEQSVWIGGETSIKVRRLEQQTEQMWLIIADFSSEPLRIETESGRLIRSEPQGSELFQFVLVKPAGADQWLLGRASAYKKE